MKYILFTYDGHGMALAHHLQMEGRDVMVGQVQDLQDVVTDMEKDIPAETKEEKNRRLMLFDGILEKYPAHELIERMKHFKNPEEYFVIFDFNSLFKFAEQIKKLGFHGNFPTLEDRMFEVDRDKANAFVKKHYDHMRSPKSYQFKTVDEGVEFLKKTDDIWVLKGRDVKTLTIVPDIDDPRLAANQIMEALDGNRSVYDKTGYLLEYKIPWIIEMTPEMIFYDGVPIAATIDIENKSFGSANTSFQTGCSMDLVFPVRMEDKIIEMAFPPIVYEMAKKRKGLFFWDASILISGKTGNFYFGEFCPNRLGYNAIFTEMALARSVNHFCRSAVEQKNPFRYGRAATSVRLFNLRRDDKHLEVYDQRIVDFAPEIEENLWFFDAMKTNEHFQSVGYSMNLAVITGRSDSIEGAVHKMYRRVDKFSFEGAYYRPEFDYTSTEYWSSILNRYEEGFQKGLYKEPF